MSWTCGMLLIRKEQSGTWTGREARQQTCSQYLAAKATPYGEGPMHRGPVAFLMEGSSIHQYESARMPLVVANTTYPLSMLRLSSLLHTRTKR